MSNQTSSSSVITVNGIHIQIVRKDIKNLHLAVYPPDGHVKVAAPRKTTEENVRLAVISKLSWIKRQQEDFKNQPRQSERKYISGECHFFLGNKYKFELIEGPGKHQIQFLKSGKLRMRVRHNSSIESKDKLLSSWYRSELKKMIPELLKKWTPKVGKEPSSWGIKKMKTKWGSCNTETGSIWLNLELAKKPIDCLEYLLVHELIHLHERNHNERFKKMLNDLMPDWKSRRDLLNRSPLAHEDWEY
jgi:predicted metal-dependent hydrolase